MGQDNAQQIDYWNGEAGHTWVAAQDSLDRMLAPITRALLDRAGAASGERIVDVGCGCGETTVALAGTGAKVWGIDISEPMLAHARSRAGGNPGVAFSRTDAATQSFTDDHDLVFSRFGVMFFADPHDAFANLRTALRPGGRLCFVCWQSPRDNPWVSIAGAALKPFLPEPAETPDPREPGPFAFADPDYLQSIVDGAGFEDVAIEPLTPRLKVADDLEGALDFMARVGPMSRAMTELEGRARDDALEAVRAALAPHLGPDGLRLDAACWLVNARAG
jgi:SAM-dependent methyltransferase